MVKARIKGQVKLADKSKARQHDQKPYPFCSFFLALIV